MKGLFHLCLLLSGSLYLTGCGGGGDEAMPPAPPPPPADPTVNAMAPAQPSTPAPSAPPVGGGAAIPDSSPQPDIMASYRVAKDGSASKSDLEALQAIVDGYAFGPDGMGAPPLKTLDDLVTKGYLKKLPAAPQGMKWAYDPPKWKVSLVPQ